MINEYGYFDLETEPDRALEKRWGLPDLIEMDRLPPPSEVVAGNAKDVMEFLKAYDPLALPPSWLAYLRHAETSSKNRSTVVNAIDNARGARDERVAGFALDPELCRVVAAGYALDDGEIRVQLGRRDQEKRVLEFIWDGLHYSSTVVGYNIVAFDLRVLLSRSMHHKVCATVPVNLNPWQNPWNDPFAIDIMTVRFGRGRAKTLKALARDMGLEPLASGADGSMVSEMTDEELIRYQESDIDLTRRVHLAGGGYYWPVPTRRVDEIPF